MNKKAMGFILKQINQVRKGGFSVLFGKIHKILLLLLAIPLVVLIRLLRPLVIIRLKRFEIGRIGHLIAAGWYLCERQAGLHKKNNFDIFYFISSTNLVSNKQWVRMWRGILRVFPFGQFALAVDNLDRWLPGYIDNPIPEYDKGAIKGPTENEALVKCILAFTKPFLAFTPQEEMMGRKILQELGLPEGAHFVCFHARDSAYLDALYLGMNTRYHDYRDSNIQNYILGMEELARRGYYAVRMGAIVKEKLAVNNPAIIDYAKNGKRTDFLDIYLGAKCSFFLCSDSGISMVPDAFRRPIVYVNYVPLQRVPVWTQTAVIIFKKFYSRRKNRFLTFREIIDSEIGNVKKGEIFEQLEIGLIENTSEEIMAVAIEMDERLKGSWETTAEDERLQQRFWNIFVPSKLKSPNLRIGSEFLRQNRHLLD